MSPFDMLPERAQTRWVRNEAKRAIERLPYLIYGGFDTDTALDEYVTSIIRPTLRLRDVDATTRILDAGCGYGWLAIALALTTSAHIIAADVNAERIGRARHIARLIGVADRIAWVVGDIAALPLTLGAVDITFCVEVLEHCGGRPGLVRSLAQTTSDLLVITTPNKLFPVIGHDTSLPFCHWLPLPLRDMYATLFGRRALQEGNQFLSPRAVLSELRDFRRVSGFLLFESFADYARANPVSAFKQRSLRGERLRRAVYRAASVAGPAAFHLLPTIAGVFRRRA